MNHSLSAKYYQKHKEGVQKITRGRISPKKKKKKSVNMSAHDKTFRI